MTRSPQPRDRSERRRAAPKALTSAARRAEDFPVSRRAAPKALTSAARRAEDFPVSRRAAPKALPWATTVRLGRALPAMLCGLLAAGSVLAQALSAPKDRITDQAIHADYRTYEQLQERIRALNSAQRPLRDYQLSKAQCWLDVSFHEYTRNDRSAFPQQALEQSLILVQGMETGRTDLPTDTPLVNDATRLRPDLWAGAEALKGQPGWPCAAQRVACAEVELVHAGNEFAQQGWRHANPYVQMAEDLLAQARSQAQACVPPAAPQAGVPAPAPTPVPVAVAPAPTAPAVRAPQPLEFQANVLFNHDRSERSQARTLTLERLDAAIARTKEPGTQLQAVLLVGHADRTGTPAYNQALAERRVQTVRDFLIARGIAASLIQTRVRGDTDPVTECRGKFPSHAQELECLLPNRRVEVNFQTLRQR